MWPLLLNTTWSSFRGSEPGKRPEETFLDTGVFGGGVAVAEGPFAQLAECPPNSGRGLGGSASRYERPGGWISPAPSV